MRVSDCVSFGPVVLKNNQTHIHFMMQSHSSGPDMKNLLTLDTESLILILGESLDIVVY